MVGWKPVVGLAVVAPPKLGRSEPPKPVVRVDPPNPPPEPPPKPLWVDPPEEVPPKLVWDVLPKPLCDEVPPKPVREVLPKVVWDVLPKPLCDELLPNPAWDVLVNARCVPPKLPADEPPTCPVLRMASPWSPKPCPPETAPPK